MKPDNTQTAKAEIDFSPLNDPVTQADLEAYTTFEKKTDGKLTTISNVLLNVTYFGGISFVVVMVAISVIGEHGLGVFGALGVIILILGLAAAAGYGIWRMIKASTREAARLYKFTTRNDLAYINMQDDPEYAGMIFDEGHSRFIRLAFGFPGRAEIGNYTYVTGSGKNRTTHHWAYVKTKLDRRLPHMVLDAKKNNFLGKFSNLTDTFDKSQTLSLEGDFDTHFTLYAPQQYERDALYIFTPDVMAALIDSGSSYDMEVIDDELYIYRVSHFNLASEQELRRMLAVVDTIQAQLRGQAVRYADERVGDRAQNIVAPQGARLKRGINWLTIILIISFVLYMLEPFIEAFFER